MLVLFVLMLLNNGKSVVYSQLPPGIGVEEYECLPATISPCEHACENGGTAQNPTSTEVIPSIVPPDVCSWTGAIGINCDMQDNPANQECGQLVLYDGHGCANGGIMINAVPAYTKACLQYTSPWL